MKAFFDSEKGPTFCGAAQVSAVLAVVVGLGLASSQDGTRALPALLFFLAAAALCAAASLALATSYPRVGSRVRWAGHLAIVMLVAFTVGAPGASAQEASAPPEASPDASASAPSEGTGQISMEQTTRSSDEVGGEGEVGKAGSLSKGIDLGSVQVGDGCVRAGDITVGDCDDEEGSGSGGPSPEHEQGSPEATAPESASPEATAPESASPEATADAPAPEDASPAPGEGAEDADEGPSPTPVPGPAAGSCATEGPKEKTRDAVIEEVVDGDTAELAEPIKGTTTVRFIGVDTPETVDPEEEPEPFGKEASAFTEKALEGEEVALELGEDAKDYYGRLLAYPWTDEGMFSETLISEGMGELLIIPPNDTYEECLTAAEEKAKAQKLGLWALGADDGTDPQPPAPESSPPADQGEASPDPASPHAEQTTPEAPQEAEEPLAPPAGDAEEPPGASPAPEPDSSPQATEPKATSSPKTQAAEPPIQPPVEPEADQPGLAFGTPQTVEPPVQDPLAETSQPPIEAPATPSASPSASPSATPGVTQDQYSAEPSAGVSSPEPEIVLPDSGGAPAEIAALEQTGAATGPSPWAQPVAFVASLAMLLVGGTILGAHAAPALRTALLAYLSRNTRD